MNCWLIVLSILATFTLSSTTLAGPVTWEFAGEVTSVRDDENLLGGEVSIGSLFSGFFTFESTAGDSSSGPNSGLYTNSLIAFNGQAGPLTFSGPTGFNFIAVRDGNDIVSSDGFSVNTTMLFSDRQGSVSLELVDDDGTVFRNDFLPLTPPLLHEFESAEFLILITQGKGSPITRIEGVVTSLVPEPNTLILLSLGAGMIFKRKRL